MKIHYIILLSAALMMCSCAGHIESAVVIDESTASDDDTFENTVNECVAHVPSIEFVEEETKSSIDLSGHFSWNKYDRIGFWPMESETVYSVRQALFYVDDPTPEYAAFKANGWGLLQGRKYHSYYPYDANAAYNCVTMDYSGQVQSANNNSTHLGDKDFLHSYTTSEITKKDKVTLQYKHLGVIARFTLTLDDYYPVRFNELSLSSTENVLIPSATYNPSEDNPSLDCVHDKQFNISLNGSAGFEYDSNRKITVYAMMCPTDWAGKTIRVTLKDTEGNLYTGSFKPKSNQEAGKGYGYSAVLKKSPSIINLDEPYGSANSYIVESDVEKTYSFPLVRGNSETAVTGVTGVKVLWETVNTTNAPTRNSIIKDVTFEGGRIQFTATGTPGNAVIAAHDNAGEGQGKGEDFCKEGHVLWSWHIWCPDGTPEDDIYGSHKLMDRNLGALNNTPGDVGSVGLLYQWGRKDPFLGGTSFVSTDITRAKARVSDGSSVNIHNRKAQGYNGNDPSSLKYENELNYPTVFFCGTSEQQKWCQDFNTSYWAADKTVNDPCPPGYRVSDSGEDLNIQFVSHVGDFKSCQGQYLRSGDSGNDYFWPMTGTYKEEFVSGHETDADGGYDYSGVSAQYWTVAAGSSYTPGRYVGYTINCSWTQAQAPDKNRYSPSYVTAGNPIRCQKIND